MMKKIMTIFSAMLLIISLSACSSDFNVSRTGNDNQLIMEYTVFNTTGPQDLAVEAGDAIYMEIITEDGHLSYKTRKDNDEPIAESKNIFFSGEFDVEVKKNGAYTVTVTRERAEENVKFTVENAE